MRSCVNISSNIESPGGPGNVWWDAFLCLPQPLANVYQLTWYRTTQTNNQGCIAWREGYVVLWCSAFVSSLF